MMPHDSVTDWDDAYANGAHIVGSDGFPRRWVRAAAAFREKLGARARLDIVYGAGIRNRMDLFLPRGRPAGLVVFIHGGYWLRFDKDSWSHLAAGAIAHGHAVAMPSYTLCPDARIGQISREVAAAVAHTAGMVDGPIRLVGHSAGGHLAARMVTRSSPLSEAVRGRVVHTLSISGLHDLRPMMRTAMNADLRIDAKEAWAESPALLEPDEGARATCWAGGAERAEFRRQSALLANVWRGLGARTLAIEEPDRHHFDVIDGLADPDHALTRMLLTGDVAATPPMKGSGR